MMHRLFSEMKSFPTLWLRRLSSVKLKLDLSHEMKSLNDKKQFERALELYDRYSKNHIDSVSSSVVVQAIKACARTKDLKRGCSIHSRMAPSIRKDPYLIASLIHMYAECDDIPTAESLFNATKHKSLAMNAAMMKAYTKSNRAKEAINLFLEIERPDEVTAILCFNACAALKTPEAINTAQSLCKKLPKCFFSNPRVLTSCLDALMKCGDVNHAESMFFASKEKALSMYGAMMKGYMDNDLAEKVIELFQHIKDPNNVNINMTSDTFTNRKTNECLHSMHELPKSVPKSIFSDPHVFTSLLHALMTCGYIEYAEALFRMSNEKTLHSYGAMMKGYIQNNLPEKAVNLFREIKSVDDVNMILIFNACAQLKTSESLELLRKLSKSIPKRFLKNPRVFTSLLDGLIKCGDVEYAESLFYGSTVKSLSSYTIMIGIALKQNNPTKALNLFDEMTVNGVEKDHVVYLAAIKAISNISDYSLAQLIVQQMPKSIFIEHKIQNALIDLWGKVGSVKNSKHIFDNLSQRDEISYAAMVNVYGLNGMGIQAVELFHRIPDELRGDAASVCVLNACSHAGLISEARLIFQNSQMKTTKIYTAMIDCLSRASCFPEAQSLINEYEQNHPPQPEMYTALLSGARNAKNTSLSQTVYDKIKTLFPQTESAIASGAILLANTYASSGDLDKASEIRQWLVKSRMHKKAGVTWTVINGKVYTFTAHDQSHPRANEIHAECEKISNELLKHGHEYDGSWITRPLNQDETVGSVLCGHSERLAIAWNFVVNPNVSRIQLSKNLRVCGDCHRSTKLIAAIRQCEIIVRDANRVHHFYTNGQCSCNDYF